jgi:hypothetical protein
MVQGAVETVIHENKVKGKRARVPAPHGQNQNLHFWQLRFPPFDSAQGRLSRKGCEKWGTLLRGSLKEVPETIFSD